jgi:hypothetical protein
LFALPRARHCVRTITAIAVLVLGAGCTEPAERTNNRPAATQDLPIQLRDGATTLGASLEQLGLTGVDVHVVGDLLLLAVDIERYEPLLLADTDKGLSAVDALAAPGMAIVIGSGFVSELHSLQPVGLLQIDGEVLSNVQPHGYTRILGINDQGFGVVHRGDYQRGLFTYALQAGPGIVEGGDLDISTRDLERPKYFRSFVATCGARVVIGISLTPMNLYTVGQELVAAFPNLDLSCDEVVNLAGDREAVLAAKSGNDNDIVYHGHPNTHKVSLLGFRAR